MFFLFSMFYLLSFFKGPAAAATVGSSIRQGNKLYAEKKYEDAVQRYQKALKKQSESDIINFNIGSAYYQSGDFEKAAGHFQKALLSPDNKLRQGAYYNLGNTFYRQGEAVGPQNPQAALPLLERSLAQYEQALQISPEDEDTKFNYEFVKHVLEKVKEQIEKQKKQCDNPKESQENDSSNNKEDQQQGAQENKGASTDEKNSSAGQDDREEKQQDTGSQEQDNDVKETPQESQEQQSAGTQDTGDQEDNQGQGNTPLAAREEQNDLSRQEARMRLRDYENNDEPKGLLNLRGTFDTRAVEKDW